MLGRLASVVAKQILSGFQIVSSLRYLSHDLKSTA
jgi:hypothetical protein